MSDLILSRRKFFGLFGGAVTSAIISPHVTYFLPPTNGWTSDKTFADLMYPGIAEIFKDSFFARNLVSEDENISMTEADIKLSNGLYIPTKSQIEKYKEYRSYFNTTVVKLINFEPVIELETNDNDKRRLNHIRSRNCR
jgi:hypothetical protein